MGLLQKRMPNRNYEKARNSIVTRRADSKLDHVAKLLGTAAAGRHTGTESYQLRKKLQFRDLGYLEFLDLKYNFENRFFAVTYDLELSTEITTNERFREIGSCVFDVVKKGLVRTSGVQWTCTSWGGEDTEERDRCLERLNNPLIAKRIIELDLHRLHVTHRENTGYWFIQCDSMVGSATWMLIPPVTNLITPTQEECVKFLELFELVADAVANNIS